MTALEALRDQIGHEVAVSDWLTVSQEIIDRFADTTGDDQWIHVDEVRAGRESPYASTVAHGFLTLSLIGRLLRDSIALDGVRMTVNYGSDRVRFTAPVRAGSRIRGRFAVGSVEARGEAVKVVWKVTVEKLVEDGAPASAGHQDRLKPVLHAEWIVLYYR